MEKHTKELLEAALDLPASERAELVDLLVPTLNWSEAAESAWTEEIERRWRRFETGEAKGVSWEHLKERARQPRDA